MARYYAPALDKGLDILEYLSEISIPQSQQEIAEGIGRTPNEIYRMLVSLENRGYIKKDSESGKFSLTLRLFRLAHHHSSVDTIVKGAVEHMEDLANKINQSVHLSVLYNDKLMVVAQAKSRTPVSLSVEIGSLFPLEKTISGKKILSHLSVEKRNQILARSEIYQQMSNAEKEQLNDELKRIVSESCSYSKSELTEGVSDFATAILDMQQEIIAVLAVSTLTSQMRRFVSAEIIEKEILITRDKIRRALGVV